MKFNKTMCLAALGAVLLVSGVYHSKKVTSEKKATEAARTVSGSTIVTVRANSFAAEFQK